MTILHNAHNHLLSSLSKKNVIAASKFRFESTAPRDLSFYELDSAFNVFLFFFFSVIETQSNVSQEKGKKIAPMHTRRAAPNAGCTAGTPQIRLCEVIDQRLCVLPLCSYYSSCTGTSGRHNAENSPPLEKEKCYPRCVAMPRSRSHITVHSAWLQAQSHPLENHPGRESRPSARPSWYN